MPLLSRLDYYRGTHIHHLSHLSFSLSSVRACVRAWCMLVCTYHLSIRHNQEGSKQNTSFTLGLSCSFSIRIRANSWKCVFLNASTSTNCTAVCVKDVEEANQSMTTFRTTKAGTFNGCREENNETSSRYCSMCGRVAAYSNL